MSSRVLKVITIDGDTLKFEARTALGSLYDAFQLQKRPGQINELTEIDPELEMRTRPEPVKDTTTVGSTR